MSQISEMDDELLPEYDLTKLQLVERGQGRKRAATNIKLEPDVAELFPDSGAVNEGLRLLMRLLNQASSPEHGQLQK
ncbi:MAG: hypothetical protein AAFQ95_02205 [Cyanobacteria bacterium J06621_3]